MIYGISVRILRADNQCGEHKMEEKTTKRKKRRKRRIALPVMATLAVVSVLSAVYLIYNILEKSNNPLLTNQPDISLPNFVGMTETQVNENVDFQYETEYVYSNEYEKDVVISQKPTAPRTVKKNSIVKLKISKGVMTSTMPDLEKQPRNQAEMALRETGADIYIKMEERNDFPEGLVIRTEPQAGETISSSDVVTLYVAVEEVKRTRTVPLVVGSHVDDARRMISNAGLRVRVVETVNEQPPGTVIWQQHGAGAELPVSTQIEIHVSIGPQ